MSRSNPSAGKLVNPCQRWHEWKGGEGKLVYYDKEAEKNVDVKLPFTFLVLDRLATIKGFDKNNDCGIYSNEVRDTTMETLHVKSFKGGPIASGIYQDIKDEVKSWGGGFANNLYIACKGDGTLMLASLMIRGAALGPWIDFLKENPRAMDEGAVQLSIGEKDQNGRVTFWRPRFVAKPVSADTDEAARALDVQLQGYLTAYFAMQRAPKQDLPEAAPRRDTADDGPPPHTDEDAPPPQDEEDDIPFS